jgi:hypothetical protein
MPQPQPTLPTKRTFVVLFRVQPPGAPMAWDGRAEPVGLGAGDTLLLAGRVTGVHAPRPGGRAGPMKRVGRALPVPERPPVAPLADKKGGATRSTQPLEKQGISRLTSNAGSQETRDHPCMSLLLPSPHGKGDRHAPTCGPVRTHACAAARGHASA